MKNKTKTKTGMVKLRKKIVFTFIWVTFLTGLINGIFDFIFTLIEPMIKQDERILIAALPLAMIMSFVTYIVGGLIFYLVVRKAIRKESERQVKENNLMYAAVAHD